MGDGDDVAGRAQSIAEDGLARATNAQKIAEEALDHSAAARRYGEDARAHADNAIATAEQAARQLAEALAGGVGVDDLARVQALAEDGLARATNAQKIAEEALEHATAARRYSEDARAHADNAMTAAEQTARGAAQASRAGADALARAREASAAADTATAAAHDALLPGRMAAFATWLELMPPVEELTISVILPTRDRRALLPRAVASVLEQEYQRWELIVVDDGETDAVANVLADVEDERVGTVEGPRSGLSAARNAGLAATRGDAIAYLDDDNAMHPRWLQAVAQVFATRADVDVLYGVTLAEYLVEGTPANAGWPGLWQLPWSRERLLEQNVTDAGALAHRRELPEARFDESLRTGEDWDLLLRLTADRPALAVPALSHAYALSGEDRMSRDPSHERGLEEIRQRHGSDC